MSVCACNACGQFFVTQEVPRACAEPCRQCGRPLRLADAAEMLSYVQSLTAKAPPVLGFGPSTIRR